MNKKFVLSLKVAYIVFLVGVTVSTITLVCVDFTFTKVEIGLLFMAGAIPHLNEFIESRKHRLVRSIFLVLVVAGFLFGFGMVFDKKLTFDNVCLIFGLLDICRGISEIVINGVIYKKSPKNMVNFLNYGVSVGDIIFGVILSIKGAHGLVGHLLYMSFAFLVMAGLEIYFIKKEHEESSHSH